MSEKRGIPVWRPFPWEKRRTDSSIRPMSLYQCGRERQPSQGGNPIIRNHLLFFYVVEGKGTFYQEDEVFPVVSGQVFVVLPQYITDYKSDENDPWEYYFLTFTGDFDDMDVNISTLGISKERCVITLAPPISVISQWLNHVIDSFLTPNENEFRSMGYLNLFLAEIFDASPMKKAKEYKNQFIDVIIRYIQVNHDQDLTVEGLSKQFSISRSHMFRLFKEHSGVSPQQYIINTRIEAVKTFLTSSNFSMKQIAQLCGFKDSMHMSSVFKTQTSLSPTQYRVRNQM